MFYISIKFFSYNDSFIFIPWKDNIWSLYTLRLLLALVFPLVIGYMMFDLVSNEKVQNFITFTTSYFIGVLIMLVTFLALDTTGIPKYSGLLFVGIIFLLFKIVKIINVDRHKNGSKYVNFPISPNALILFVFAMALFSSVYLNYNSFVKGDLWKQTATASVIQLGGLSNFLKNIKEMCLYEYPSFFFYFLASTADAFSLPLANVAMGLAVLVPAVSILAMLSFFSAIEGGNQGRARWATLLWFTFSGFGMLYLLLEYGSLQPSPDLALTLMNKLGWGSGLVYSPSLGSFAHILRLFSLAGALQCHSMLIYQGHSLRKLFLASCALIVAIIFHPLMSILASMFIWFNYLFTKNDIAIRLVVVTILSLGVILFFEKVFSPVSIFYDNLTVLVVSIIIVVTILANLARKIVKIRFKIFKKAKYGFNTFFKVLLLTVVLSYVHSTIILHLNYDMLYLERFPTVPLYAWPNILGLPGFLALALIGVIILGKKSPTFGEKYFSIFTISALLASLVLDYNNVHQVIEFFNPNLISFRFIPIVSISISYLAGGFIYRIQEIIFNDSAFKDKNYYINISALILIGILLAFFFTSIQPRISFWMNNNWPSTELDFSISEEDLSLIKYLRNQINEDEFLAVEGGKASVLGRKVSLSGAKVISKDLADVFFRSESIKTFSVLKETLKINYIIRQKHLKQSDDLNTVYAVDGILKNEKPVFQTENYEIFQLHEFSKYLNETETIYLNITNPFHYGIFSDKEVRFIGNTIVHSDYLKIDNLKILNQTSIEIPKKLNNITIRGDSKISLFHTKGMLDKSFSKNTSMLKLTQITSTKISIKEGVLEWEYNEEKYEIKLNEPCNVTGLIKPGIIKANNPKLEVNGHVLLNDVRLTWPYIEIIGSQGDATLIGVINFQVLSIRDKFFVMRLTSLRNLKSYSQDVAREKILRFNQHCNEILLFPQVNSLTMRDMYIISKVLLTFLMGYLLLVSIVTGKLRIYITTHTKTVK